MIRSFVRLFSLTVICAVVFSCGESNSYLRDSMVSSVTDAAINSAKGSTSDTSSKSKRGGFWGGGSGDAHFIEDDYIFIAKEPYKSGWIQVYVTKMVTPATSATKGEAKFMMIANGEEVWTKYYWSTRIATEADLKVGKIVIASEAHNDEGVYRGPEQKSETYENWFMSKITDMSEKHKGYVTVAGNYKVSIDALRVTVAAK